MLNVVVGVLLTAALGLATRWVLEGGIKRRNLHMVREELELAALLGDDPDAADLRASAAMRLRRYLQPSLWVTFRTLSALQVAVVGCVGVVTVVAAVLTVGLLVGALKGKTPAEGFLLTGIIGVLAGTVVAMLETWIDKLLETRFFQPAVTAPESGDD